MAALFYCKAETTGGGSDSRRPTHQMVAAKPARVSNGSVDCLGVLARSLGRLEMNLRGAQLVHACTAFVEAQLPCSDALAILGGGHAKDPAERCSEVAVT